MDAELRSTSPTGGSRRLCLSLPGPPLLPLPPDTALLLPGSPCDHFLSPWSPAGQAGPQQARGEPRTPSRALTPCSPSRGKNLEEFLRPRQAAPEAGGWGLWREGATCRPASWALAVAQCGTRAWSFPPGLRESSVLEGKRGPPEANGWQGRPLSPVPPRSARPATSLISLEP